MQWLAQTLAGSCRIHPVASDWSSESKDLEAAALASDSSFANSCDPVSSRSSSRTGDGCVTNGTKRSSARSIRPTSTSTTLTSLSSWGGSQSARLGSSGAWGRLPGPPPDLEAATPNAIASPYAMTLSELHSCKPVHGRVSMRGACEVSATAMPVIDGRPGRSSSFSRASDPDSRPAYHAAASALLAPGPPLACAMASTSSASSMDPSCRLPPHARTDATQPCRPSSELSDSSRLGATVKQDPATAVNLSWPDPAACPTPRRPSTLPTSPPPLPRSPVSPIRLPEGVLGCEGGAGTTQLPEAASGAVRPAGQGQSRTQGWHAPCHPHSPSLTPHQPTHPPTTSPKPRLGALPRHLPSPSCAQGNQAQVLLPAHPAPRPAQAHSAAAPTPVPAMSSSLSTCSTVPPSACTVSGDCAWQQDVQGQARPGQHTATSGCSEDFSAAGSSSRISPEWPQGPPLSDLQGEVLEGQGIGSLPWSPSPVYADDGPTPCQDADFSSPRSWRQAEQGARHSPCKATTRRPLPLLASKSGPLLGNSQSPPPSKPASPSLAASPTKPQAPGWVSPPTKRSPLAWAEAAAARLVAGHRAAVPEAGAKGAGAGTGLGGTAGGWGTEQLRGFGWGAPLIRMTGLSGGAAAGIHTVVKQMASPSQSGAQHCVLDSHGNDTRRDASKAQAGGWQQHKAAGAQPGNPVWRDPGRDAGWGQGMGDQHARRPPAATAAPRPLLAGQAASKVSLGEQSCHVWSVAFDELVLKQQIGSGGFGNVYFGYLQGSPVAIKVAVLRPLHPSPAAGLAAACPDQQSASAHASTVAEFQREVTTMSRIPHHPNVLRLLAACVELPHLALVTEYCPRGSLYSLLHSHTAPPLSLRQVLTLCLGAARGMAHLHACRPPILHRDLKSANLLLDDMGSVKIADFGLSKQQAHSPREAMTGGLGTYQWTAPEVLSHQHYSIRADVFSFAVVMWECLTRKLPYAGLAPFQAATAVVYQGLRPDIPACTPPSLAALIKACWAAVPDQRPSFNAVVADLQQQLEQVQ
ncbi:hypothetical protein V8C86DRAFT_2592545 [Haematococcus lacustris]